MKKLFRYAKPYWYMFLIAIGLLFAQANLDLALPDYLSDIVDTGIQQGGIVNVAPIAIRESKLNKTFLFSSSENKTAILEAYNLVTENSTNYNSSLGTYPLLANQSLYIRKDITQAKLDQINGLLKKPIVTVFILDEALANPENFTEIWAALGIDPTSLPPGVDFYDYLGTLSLANRTLIMEGITASFDALGAGMLYQTAIMAIRMEYDIIGLNTDRIQTMYILKSGGLMLLMTFLSISCTIAVSFLGAKTAAGVARDMRGDLFEKVENFSNVEFDSFSTASLITRSTNDVTQIQLVIYMIIRMVFYAPILGVGGVIRALNKNTTMWWLIGVAVLVLLVLILIVFLIAVPKFNKIQSLTDRINLIAREGLMGMMVIRAFNREKHEEKRFDKANQDLTSVILFINRLLVILMPFMMLVMNGLMVSIIWVGSNQVDSGNMQVGDMLAFMQYAMLIVFAFLMLTMMFIVLPRAVVSARRINEVLVTEPVIEDPEEPQEFPEEFKGIIEFKDVSFRYPGAEDCALEKINFTAQPGKTTALIGSTGSGKSTIVNLILRLYDVNKGSIQIDGIDIRNVTQHDLREKIGYVPQKSTLFSGTIESNLLFADENATDETLADAIEIAQAKDFVFEEENGLERAIAQGGTNVSGGQKQRLSIARALVKKPPIYIFDDSVSALDFKTESALRQALKEKTNNSTVLMITQRVSTAKSAEQILVLDEGRIIGQGNHDELMESCDIYKEIAISQLELEDFA